MTDEEYIEIIDKIDDINFDIYELNTELKGLNSFLDYLQNKCVQTKENIECVKTVKEEIAKKENHIRLLRKERGYYQEIASGIYEREDK